MRKEVNALSIKETSCYNNCGIDDWKFAPGMTRKIYHYYCSRECAIEDLKDRGVDISEDADMDEIEKAMEGIRYADSINNL